MGATKLQKLGGLLMLFSSLTLAGSVLLTGRFAEEETLEWFSILYLLGGLMMGSGGLILLQLRGKISMDERFIIHRLKSTRFAMLTGLIGILVYMLYETAANGVPRWDLLIITGVFALAKLGAMTYYRLTQ